MNTSLRRRILTGIAALTVVGVPLFAAGCADPTGLAASLDNSTVINISLSNRTTLPLTLVSASHGGTDPHWGNEAPQTLAPGALVLVSDNSAGDDTIDLEYQDSTGATYTFHAGDPVVGDDWVSHTTTSTSYDVYSQNGSGRTDNVAFMVYPGHEFDTSGAAQTYVVPPGVTQLKVDIVGGSTISDVGTARGAQVDGMLAVTPGQLLTVGVGGNVQDPATMTGQTTGGWGLPWEGSSFSGGQGMHSFDSINSGNARGGAGASVLVDKNLNMLVAVAGGAGGAGDCDAGGFTWCWGGSGGYQGQLTGQNGNGPGGKAGSQTLPDGGPSPAGQNSSPHVGDVANVGGAGGGGFAGGGAGPNPPGGGGGAGSSFDAGLSSPTVSTATGTAHVDLVIPELASVVG